MGVELPEGQNVTFNISIQEMSKPTVELEIYRPIIPENQLLAGGEPLYSNEKQWQTLTFMLRCRFVDASRVCGLRRRDTKACR